MRVYLKLYSKKMKEQYIPVGVKVDVLSVARPLCIQKNGIYHIFVRRINCRTAGRLLRFGKLVMSTPLVSTLP